MRVERVGAKSVNATKVKEKAPASSASFSSLLNEKKESEDREKLDKMMEKIKEKGEELVDSRNLDILVSYKKMVKDFVGQASAFAFQIVDRKGLSRMGRSKILKIISQVDEALVKLTEEFLKEERNKLNLLRKIGQLGGLLTDIYV